MLLVSESWSIHALSICTRPPQGHLEQLELIAQKFQASCIEKARASVGENDFVKLFHDALEAMGFDNLCLRTNVDWDDQSRRFSLRLTLWLLCASRAVASNDRLATPRLHHQQSASSKLPANRTSLPSPQWPTNPSLRQPMIHRNQRQCLLSHHPLSRRKRERSKTPGPTSKWACD